MRSQLSLGFLAFSLATLAGFAVPAGAQRIDSTSVKGAHSDVAYHGGVVSPPLPKPKFSLTDTAGAKFDFRSKTDGYVTLLFFGYTSCPDVCPMQMSYLAAAIKKLPRDLAMHFKVVFVTTDPERDNVQALRTWLDHMDKSFIGLTGSSSEIQSAQIEAKMPVAAGAPTYSHSSFVLAYTQDNLAHVVYPAGVTEADWLHDLPQLATETWAGPNAAHGN